MTGLQGFDVAAFLRDDWQKRPRLIRGALAHWANPLSPDELAGLACEPEVESRLVRQPAPGDWQLENGPIAPERFADLGDCPWTLLVQSVDHHVPDVAALIAPFRFVPDWRIDDVMVSYAVDGGGVGPHFDQYDVFLVQGLGRRRWRIGQRCDDATPLLPHDGLRLLAQFDAQDEWVLEPGDILYVPPGVAHDGIAVGDHCMTYSIGFRAPSRADLISAFADHLIDSMAEDDRYTDPVLSPRAHPGEITADALAKLHAMATSALADRRAFAAWFGSHVTQPRPGGLDWTPDRQMTLADLAEITVQAVIERNPASRFAFVEQGGGALTLFVDGEAYACDGQAARFARALCAGPSMVLSPEDLARPAIAAMVLELVNRGCLALAEAD